MIRWRTEVVAVFILSSVLLFPHLAKARCTILPNYAALQAQLVAAVTAETSGLKNHMWATIVDRDGIVCAVAYSGIDEGAQWPGSRVISAQKANTANAFSLDASSFSNGKGQQKGFALSTANLYSAVQPGGFLYGLQHSNPVDTADAYVGNAHTFGTVSDPMVGSRIGGVNVFGGGLALYKTGHEIVGGLGVSGDTSCTDHAVAWRLRHLLGLDHMAISGSLPAVQGPNAGTDAARPDNMILDITANPDGGTGKSAGGFGHPPCGSPPNLGTLPAVVP